MGFVFFRFVDCVFLFSGCLITFVGLLLTWLVYCGLLSGFLFAVYLLVALRYVALLISAFFMFVLCNSGLLLVV